MKKMTYIFMTLLFWGDSCCLKLKVRNNRVVGYTYDCSPTS